MHEALSVRPMDFDLQRMMLSVRGKGDKTRIIPLTDRAWGVICYHYLDVVGFQPTVINLQDRTARNIITRLGVRAGLKRRVASHDLRATFATAAYDNTGDQRAVQELLGHANGSTTEIYIGVTSDSMRKAADF